MRFLRLLLLACLVSCSSTESITQDPTTPDSTIYFPPINSDTWESVSTSELGWNETAKQELITYLNSTNTDSFIILHNGKIAMENYFGGTTQFTNSPWFSAGKTLTAFMVGVSQQEGFLDLNDSSSDYLGSGWSDLTPGQEADIKVINHITMTTGLEYSGDLFCTDPECLTYRDAPNSFWYYHNAPYTLTQSIISGAVNSNFNDYFDEKLKSKIGMNGAWIPSGFNKFYFSNARSMARFGLLCFNSGKWQDEELLNETYFNAMTSTSQNLNPSYGYLWWLNGKSSYIVPGSPMSFTGDLIPNAPDDTLSALGANDKKLYVVPSENLVIVRLGGSAGNDQLGPSSYDNELWGKIRAMID